MKPQQWEQSQKTVVCIQVKYKQLCMTMKENFNKTSLQPSGKHVRAMNTPVNPTFI